MIRENHDNIEACNTMPREILINEHETVDINRQMSKIALVYHIIFLQSRYLDLCDQLQVEPEADAMLDCKELGAVLVDLLDIEHALKYGRNGYKEAFKR